MTKQVDRAAVEAVKALLKGPDGAAKVREAIAQAKAELPRVCSRGHAVVGHNAVRDGCRLCVTRATRVEAIRAATGRGNSASRNTYPVSLCAFCDGLGFLAVEAGTGKWANRCDRCGGHGTWVAMTLKVEPS